MDGWDEWMNEHFECCCCCCLFYFAFYFVKCPFWKTIFLIPKFVFIFKFIQVWFFYSKSFILFILVVHCAKLFYKMQVCALASNNNGWMKLIFLCLRIFCCSCCWYVLWKSSFDVFFYVIVQKYRSKNVCTCWQPDDFLGFYNWIELSVLYILYPSNVRIFVISYDATGVMTYNFTN